MFVARRFRASPLDFCSKSVFRGGNGVKPDVNTCISVAETRFRRVAPPRDTHPVTRERRKRVGFSDATRAPSSKVPPLPILLLATWQQPTAQQKMQRRPGQAACLAGATRSAAIPTRSLLWTKDCANMLSGLSATGPGTAAGFRQLGQLSKTSDFMRRVCRAAQRESFR